MRCKNCGYEIYRGEKRCVNCGMPIKNKKNKGLIIAVSIIGGCCVVVFAVLLVFILGSNSEELAKDGFKDYFTINTKIKDVSDEYADENGNIPSDKKDDFIDAIVDYTKVLLNDGKIKEYNVTDKRSVWIKLNSGMEYVYTIPDSNSDPNTDSEYQPYIQIFDPEEDYIDSDDNSDDDNKEDKKSDEGISADDEEYIPLKIEELSKIGRNKIIIIRGRGGYNEKTHSYIEIGEKLDKEAFEEDPIGYTKELGYIDEFLSGDLLITESGRLAITYKCLDNKLGDLDGSMMYLGASCSGKDAYMAETLTDKGADAVVAYNDVICDDYNEKSIYTTVSGLYKKTDDGENYWTLQKAVDHSLEKNGKECCETHNSHPVIFGNKDFRIQDAISRSESESDYVSGRGIVSVNGKIIAADSKALYYKESIDSEGKSIADNENVLNILTDGETVYFDVYGSQNKSTKSGDKVYKTTVEGSESEELFETEGRADLFGFKNNCIYYVDVVNPDSGEYKCSLMKYDLESESSEKIDEWTQKAISNKYYYFSAYLSGNTIFYNKDTSLYTYDIESEETDALVKSSNGVIADIIQNKVCFLYESDDSLYIAIVGADKKIEKSEPIDSNYDWQAVTEDGKYGIFFSKDTSDFNMYTIDLKTGEKSVSEGDAGSCKNKNYFVTKDLTKRENIYFMYGVSLFDEESKKLVKQDCEEFEIDIMKPMWVVDGYVVDSELNTYKISEPKAEIEEPATEAPKDESWKKAYVDYINSKDDPGDYEYALVYVDDDDIPELFVHLKGRGPMSELCWLCDGTVCSKAIGTENLVYIEKGNCIMTTEVHTGVQSDYILQIENSELNTIHTGRANKAVKGQESFKWDDKEVSEEEYDKLLNQAFNTSNAKTTESYKSADEIIKEIESI